jgi:RNA polymerase sigma-70 factor (ECF subfamily)
MDLEDRLRELLVIHQSALRAVAFRLTHNQAEADDLVQECSVRALQKAKQLNDPARARYWLVSILRNAFLDRCRRERAEPTTDADVEQYHEAPGPDGADEPDWAALTREDLLRAVADLPPTYRTVYELRALQACSGQEVAQRIGTTASTVATRLFRARLKLLKILKRIRPRHE